MDSFAVSGGGSILPSIGLSMIVKDAEEDLRPCLESARALVDQIVIADTGSTDRTREIAAEFGATVVSFPWTDHFADARNAALAAVTTDWVLVLDADEELAPDSAGAIHTLLRDNGGIGGYSVTIRNYILQRFAQAFEQTSRVNHDDAPRAKGAPAWVEHTMVRLFRRHPDIFFTGRIHEEVDAQIQRLGLGIGNASFRIRHFGRLRDEAFRKKRSYYQELGRAKLAEQPDHYLAWYDLGCEYLAAHRLEEAMQCMSRSYELHPWAMPVLFIAAIHSQQNNPEAALHALQHVPDKDDIGLLRNEMRGDLLHDLGRLHEAQQAFQAALRFSPSRRGGDEAAREVLIESKLGYTELRLGHVRRGMTKLRRALEKAPDQLENHDRLVKALVLLGREAEAADAAEHILDHFSSEKIYLRAAALWLRTGQQARALRLVEAGSRHFPDSARLAEVRDSIRGSATEAIKDPEPVDVSAAQPASSPGESECV